MPEEMLIKFGILLDQVSNTLADLGYKKAENVEDKKLVLTPVEAMELLGVGRNTMYNDLLPNEDFPSFRVGNNWFINKKGLQEWIDKQSKKRG